MILSGTEPHSSPIVAISVLCDWRGRQHFQLQNQRALLWLCKSHWLMKTCVEV